jgi:hypothetical protein
MKAQAPPNAAAAPPDGARPRRRAGCRVTGPRCHSLLCSMPQPPSPGTAQTRRRSPAASQAPAAAAVPAAASPRRSMGSTLLTPCFGRRETCFTWAPASGSTKRCGVWACTILCAAVSLRAAEAQQARFSGMRLAGGCLPLKVGERCPIACAVALIHFPCAARPPVYRCGVAVPSSSSGTRACTPRTSTSCAASWRVRG